MRVRTGSSAQTKSCEGGAETGLYCDTADLPGGFDRAEFAGKAGGAIYAQRHRDHARDHAGYHQAGQTGGEDSGHRQRGMWTVPVRPGRCLSRPAATES